MYSFGTDTNTGMYRHGADELGFSTGGTLAGWFNSAQKFFMLGAADIAGLLNVTGVATFASTANMNLPSGTTAQRPGSPTEDMFRYNSDTHVPEFYNGTSWIPFSAPVKTPQGRLTLTSGLPVLASDVTAATTVYYTPYIGNIVPIYDGTSFVNTAFTEISMAMSGANFAANGIYDLFVSSDAGTLRLAIGPVWTTLTAGSGSRGTGAGTTELQYVGGILTNKVSITLRYASGSTFTAAANQATYVGTMVMDGTNAQVSCLVSYGQSRKYGIWNLYNQVKIIMLVGDSTASHTYASATYQAFNAASTNAAQTLCGWPINSIVARYDQYGGGSGGAVNFASAIGVNSTTTVSGIPGTGQSPQNLNTSISACTSLVPGIGTNNLTILESVNSGTCAYTGTQTNCRMAVEYFA